MKTVLQQLRATVNNMIDNGGDADFSAVITHIDILLPKEQAQIIEARITAPILPRADKSEYEEEAKEYYNKTFDAATL